MARESAFILDSGEKLPTLTMETVGYGLPVKDTARTFGAFYEERRQILQATGFLVRPDRTIAVAQYSSGPIGRLAWQDVLALVQFYKRQAAQPPKS